jgi:hypothetical protein
MKKYIYFLFVLSLVSVVTMSNKKGRATTASLGSTGAPGDDNTVCQSCHNGPINVGIEIIALSQGDTVTKYEANKTYQIHVRVNHISGNVPRGHGFQMTILNAEKGKNGPNLKELLPLSTNVKLVTPRNGRLYGEQVDRSVTNLFEIQWTAPAQGSGPVTIYSAGAAVNANDNDSGDGASKASLQLDEMIVANKDEKSAAAFAIVPNPFADKFRIQGETQMLKSAEVVNLFGKTVYQASFIDDNKAIDLSNLPDGIYFLRLIDYKNQILKTQKLMKRSLRP